jgi:hypothetical protein
MEKFLHDDSGISTIVSDVKEQINDYKENISALEKLVTNIEGSSDWIDEQVKTSFVNTAKSFVDSYKTFSAGLEGYINCLEIKSENITEHEGKFS